MMVAEKKPTKPAPLWALAIGVVVTMGGVVVLARLLADQVKAFALAQPDAGERLLWPAAAGELLLTLAVWGLLWLAFRRSWKKRRDRLYVWLGVLLAAAVTTSTFILIYDVKTARIDAIRAAAEIDRLETETVDRAAAGFADEQDADLASAVFYEMRRWADPIKGVRGLSVSRAPRSEWEAVCGQVSFKDGVWAGFVTRREDGGRLRAALEQDGFDEAKRTTCRPLAQKYLGIEGVDIKAYMAERDALGCTDIDINYWQTEKAYCHGRTVQPTR